MQPIVGVLGLGIMGSAVSANLRSAGFHVVGFDVAAERLDIFSRAGGEAANSPRQVADTADVVICLLPTVQALDDVVTGPDGVLASRRAGLILVESSTLPLEEKRRIRDAVQAEITMLDCPLSGTGAQAATKDLSIYASGDLQAYEKCIAVFSGFARSHYYLGEFGNGSKMKFVANLLVAIHNVAAAEAFVLGMKAGLDPETIYKVIGDGAGSSRMFQVRGPLMVRADYEPATMKVETWQKDMKIIADFAVRLRCPTPLFATSAAFYTAAMAQERGSQDTASVCAVLEAMAQHDRAQ